MSTRERIIRVIEDKLGHALKDVDAATEEHARAAWSGICPAPTCPSVGAVMEAAHHALAHGYSERERVANEVILSTLTPIRGAVTPALVGAVMGVVTRAFPHDKFLALVQHTPGVYKRQLASPSKFDERIYSVQLALIRTSAANISRRSVGRIQTTLDEMLLHQSNLTPVWWRRALSVIFKFIVLPVVKWVFGIASALILAALTYVLGIK